MSAIWFLGTGINSDQGYYAQSPLSVTANGASGTPTWSKSSAGTGDVSLNCFSCSSNIITSVTPSNGCVYDVTVYATYDGFKSDPFHVAIIRPSTLTNVVNPSDQIYNDGFDTYFKWLLTDTCGQSDTGLDGYETLGNFSYDYPTSNWAFPTTEPPFTNPSAVWQDQIAMRYCSGCVPPNLNPQTPLTNVKVMNAPFQLWVGSQTINKGLLMMSNTTQFYQDHGRHE